MPIRVDKPSLPPDQDLAEKASGGLSNRTATILAAVGGVIIIGLLVVLIVIMVTKPASTPPPEGPGGEVPSQTEGVPSAQGPVEELPRSNVGVGAENATSTVGSLFIHYEQTPEGAAAAALNYVVALNSAEMYRDADRHVINNYIYADDQVREQLAIDDATAAKTRTKFGLDANGEPVDKSKQVYWGIYPEYGAFQVTDIKGNQEATVMIWAPSVFGVGSTLEDLDIEWEYRFLRMAWTDGDWRIADYLDKPTPPKPADPLSVWVPFQERAQLLGRGWQLTVDATEDDIDRLDMPGR